MLFRSLFTIREPTTRGRPTVPAFTAFVAVKGLTVVFIGFCRFGSSDAILVVLGTLRDPYGVKVGSLDAILFRFGGWEARDRA